MSDSPESVVRKFFASWVDPKPDELGGFFHGAAVWVDGPQGERRGADAIKSELAAQLNAVGGVVVDVKTLLSDGGTVMVEQVSNSSIGGNPISAVVMAVFELDGDGRITQWREAYDLKSVIDQIEAAAVQRPKSNG
jgi:limonene-1,2-epoxide hydrolase